MLRGAIFDMDGTLLDSMPSWEHVADRYLAQKGIGPVPGIREQVRFLSMEQTAHFVRERFPISDPPGQIMDEINRLVENAYLYEIPAKPGTKDFLARLQSMGVRMCVATATDRYMAEPALRRNGLLPYFDFVLTCTETGTGKDTPEIFRQALGRLGTTRQDTLVFEDAIHAIRTAAGDGFRVVAVRDESMREYETEIRAIAEQYLDIITDCEVNI